MSCIRLRGVRQNNLKNFDLDIPLKQLTVITGLSGSGKSSLAFETLFAEGQRRYIETFSPYARQFFDRMDKPRVDRIEGIPPAIAVEQRNAVRSTRSTVGTMTEICEHMKVVWRHLSTLYCAGCGEQVRREGPADVWESLRKSPPSDDASAAEGDALLTFDLPLSEKLPLQESLSLVARQGYQRLLLGQAVVRIEAAAGMLASSPASSLIVVQDRLSLKPENRARFVEACEQAYHFGKGRLTVWRLTAPEKGSEAQARSPRRFSNRFHCASCDIDYSEPSPALFSFNHPLGACPECRGFGRIITIDYQLAMPDHSKTLAEGVVRPWKSGVSADCQRDLMRACKAQGIPTKIPFHQLSKEHQEWVVQGEPGYGKDEEHEWPRAWYGVKGYFRWLESKAYKMHVRVLLSRYRAYTPCPVCKARRFRPESLHFRVDWPQDWPLPVEWTRSPASETAPQPPRTQLRRTLSDFYRLTVADALRWVKEWIHSPARPQHDPLRLVLEEVHARLHYLNEAGLGYLTLDRPTRTLSGGETERVNLTTCLGTRLVNTLFVLDEPSVGLHPRDTRRLINILHRLRDTGNTVVVVEHEASVMRAADRILDLGPGQGEKGGEIVFHGPFEEILSCKRSLTGQYLRGARGMDTRPRRPVSPRLSQTPSPQKWLRLVGATAQNLRDLDVDIPLERLVCVTGVSGSGKTTLVREVLMPALLQRQSPGSTPEAGKTADDDAPESGGDASPTEAPDADARGRFRELRGAESLTRVVMVDQTALGRTPRSNPVVYVGAFDAIRKLFADSPMARERSLEAGGFSFNSPRGQCERCRGAGFEKIEMQFLSDVYVRCGDCGGRRYREHVLEVKLKPPSSPAPTVSYRPAKRGGVAGRRANLFATASASLRGSSRVDASALVLNDRMTADLERTDASEPIGSKWGEGWSIADMLDATVEDAVEFLEAFPQNREALAAARALRWLQEVGLGYLRLGQPINTLSGGESQRLKLVSFLAESSVSPRAAGKQGVTSVAAIQATLFIFDEPTTGLHFEDVRVLLNVFQRLVDAGHSLLIIEHNLDVVRAADWVIDLGPEAGSGGGNVVVAGPPSVVAECLASHTGLALREAQSADAERTRARRREEG
ncbi:MAG: excinuclease ABC subunit UvrA [Verrucomicrobia bacterium]|nr:excinuclease ABC subunit UvrA [Verrucomicrobiota bacterium]MBI3870708.1 excinuclease ABC subunit UvrA [Verrucomicrobiota bacterium]